MLQRGLGQPRGSLSGRVDSSEVACQARSVSNTRIFGKLVRDRIPDMIRASGAEPSCRTLDTSSYISALRKKVVEEAAELELASPEQLIEEMADVLETLQCLARVTGIQWSAVEFEALQKRTDRGGFERRIWLESVSTPSPESGEEEQP